MSGVLCHLFLEELQETVESYLTEQVVCLFYTEGKFKLFMYSAGTWVHVHSGMKVVSELAHSADIWFTFYN